MKKNATFGVLLLVFLIVSGWYGSNVLADLQSWNDWDKPAEIAKMWKAGLFGLIAMAMAMGLDLKSLLGPLGSFLPGGPPPPEIVSDAKRAELSNDKAGV